MRYIYAQNINKTGQNGVVDTERVVTVCICTPDFGQMICEAMNEVMPMHPDTQKDLTEIADEECEHERINNTRPLSPYCKDCGQEV